MWQVRFHCKLSTSPINWPMLMVFFSSEPAPHYLLINWMMLLAYSLCSSKYRSFTSRYQPHDFNVNCGRVNNTHDLWICVFIYSSAASFTGVLFSTLFCLLITSDSRMTANSINSIKVRILAPIHTPRVPPTLAETINSSK